MKNEIEIECLLFAHLLCLSACRLKGARVLIINCFHLNGKFLIVMNLFFEEVGGWVETFQDVNQCLFGGGGGELNILSGPCFDLLPCIKLGFN